MFPSVRNVPIGSGSFRFFGIYFPVDYFANLIYRSVPPREIISCLAWKSCCVENVLDSMGDWSIDRCIRLEEWRHGCMYVLRLGKAVAKRKHLESFFFDSLCILVWQEIMRSMIGEQSFSGGNNGCLMVQGFGILVKYWNINYLVHGEVIIDVSEFFSNERNFCLVKHDLSI